MWSIISWMTQWGYYFIYIFFIGCAKYEQFGNMFGILQYMIFFKEFSDSHLHK